MLVSLQVVAVAVVPLKVTVLDPCESRKYDPVIVTLCPTDAALGFNVVMPGDGVTVKVTPLLAVPPTVTVTGPVVAVVGTGASIAVAVQPVGAVATPLNLTALKPCVAPKLVPTVWTDVFLGPRFGVTLVTLAGCGRGATTVES